MDEARAVVINGRRIVNPDAVRLARHMNEDRATFVAGLRAERGLTFRDIAAECGRRGPRTGAGTRVLGRRCVT